LIGTSILNIVVRNPVVSAKALAAIDILSSGRLFAGVGPGSHSQQKPLYILQNVGKVTACNRK
jgi:alkanesulfonate monooxygenase SsuD/methylene tetrahydromethanopterin reductase-like flavin-dependent oxidoreductase (luciferase family)